MSHVKEDYCSSAVMPSYHVVMHNCSTENIHRVIVSALIISMVYSSMGVPFSSVALVQIKHDQKIWQPTSGILDTVN